LSGGIEPVVDAEPEPVAGFRPFHATSTELVTNDQIDQLRDQTGV
jgi:hypothetical protein